MGFKVLGSGCGLWIRGLAAGSCLRRSGVVVTPATIHKGVVVGPGSGF